MEVLDKPLTIFAPCFNCLLLDLFLRHRPFFAFSPSLLVMTALGPWAPFTLTHSPFRPSPLNTAFLERRLPLSLDVRAPLVHPPSVPPLFSLGNTFFITQA